MLCLVLVMLVFFETPVGFALFKVLDEGKLSNVEVFGLLDLLLMSFCLVFYVFVLRLMLVLLV